MPIPFPDIPNSVALGHFSCRLYWLLTSGSLDQAARDESRSEAASCPLLAVLQAGVTQRQITTRPSGAAPSRPICYALGTSRGTKQNCRGGHGAGSDPAVSGGTVPVRRQPRSRLGRS